MKKFLMLFAVLTVAVLFVMAVSSEPDVAFSTAVASGVSAFTNSRAIRIPIPGRSAVAGVSMLTNSPAMPKQTNFGPGVYSAKPYSMIVVVPSAIDEKMVVTAGNPDPKMPVTIPKLHLEKR